MYQQRKSSHLQPAHSNQFIANKFRQQPTLNASQSNPGNLKEIYETSQSDQIRQQRFVTSRKTAVKRAQRLLSASRNQMSAQRNQLPLQNLNHFDKNQTLAFSHSSNLPLHQHLNGNSLLTERPPLHAGGGVKSNVLSSVQSSIDYNNGKHASPHANPILSSETSRQNSVRQSLAFINSGVPDNFVEVQNNRYNSCQAEVSNHINNQIVNNSESAQEQMESMAIGGNLLAMSSAVNLNTRESSASFNLVNVASNQSLPPLSKQLMQRRSQMHPISNSIGGSSHSLPKNQFNQSKALVKIGQGVTQSQSMSLNKLSLSQKRQQTGSRQQQATLLVPQMNSLTANETIETSSQNFGAIVRSRFQQPRSGHPTNLNATVSLNNVQLPQQSSHRLQRMPSMRKRRIDMNIGSVDPNSHKSFNSLEDCTQIQNNQILQQQISHEKRSLAHATADAPIVQIKSRISLASAAVDSRRSSTKRIKGEVNSNQRSRKVTQNNFYTIPVKDNTSLPTPLDSNHKEDAATNSCKVSSKGFETQTIRQNMGQELQSMPIPTTSSTAAKSQRQLRYAGAVPSQRFQILEEQHNFNTALTARHAEQQQRQVELHSYQKRPAKQAETSSIQPNSLSSNSKIKTLPIAFMHQQKLRQTVASRENSLENDRSYHSHANQQQENELPSTGYYLPVRGKQSDHKVNQNNLSGPKSTSQAQQIVARSQVAASLLTPSQQFSSYDATVGGVGDKNSNVTVMQGLNCPSQMFKSLQQRNSGTRNANQHGLAQTMSQEQVSKKEPMEFDVSERRADSRPRGGPGAGQRFQQMRQRLNQIPYQLANKSSHADQNLNQRAFLKHTFNNSFAQETTSIEINESLRGIDPIQLLKIQAQFSGADHEISRKIREGEATTGKEPNSAHQFINEMSYIQNASSNDNLLSPNMFSNNSLSPSNPPFLEQQPSLINNSLEPFNPHENYQNQATFSSLERSMQRAGLPQDNSRFVFDSGNRVPVTRQIKRSFIRKMSGPASKLFPPGFFADQNSIDSGNSPMKMSLGSDTELRQPQNPVTMSIRSNPLQPNEIFSQFSSAQVKQSEALSKVKALVSQQKKLSHCKPHLNVTLSPTRCDLEIIRNPSLDDRQTKQNSTNVVIKKSLGQFNKDRLSQPQKVNYNPVSLVNHKFTEPFLHNEVKLRVQPTEISNQEAIMAIDNSIQLGCDALNVPLPSSATQSILERNNSQLQNLPEADLDQMPIQNQSKSHCPSKMKVKNNVGYSARNNNLLVLTTNNNTKMSKRTDDTFSDRVQKMHKNNSNQRSTLASKETNRTIVPQVKANLITQASQQQAEQEHLNNLAASSQVYLNQNWVAAQKPKKVLTMINTKELINQSSSTTTIPDTSIGILSQSTAAASSGNKIQNKNNAKLQHILKKQQAGQPQNFVVKHKLNTNAVEQGKKQQSTSASVSARQGNQKIVIKFKNASQSKKAIEQSSSSSATMPQAQINHKFTNSKTVPKLPMQLIQNDRFSSKASSPPEEFTPYMNGVLSPNDTDDSNLVSPGRKDLITMTRGDPEFSSKIKVVSFGQSRCNSSQMAPEVLINTGPTAGHTNQGIMTFGNFATLLQEQQQFQQNSSQRTFGQQSSRRTLPETGNNIQANVNQ